jgi:hypothetical protein
MPDARQSAVGASHQTSPDECPRPPIFIVGCHRSGTTLLRLILDSHPNISCGPETRFLRDLKHLTRDSWSQLSLYGFPREYWHAKVATMFGSFQQDYANRRGKRRWADKTPLYAMSLDYIIELFPHAQVIHVIRDGRDVVASHRSTFGYWSAVKSTAKWHRYVNTVRAVGSQLPRDQYFELRYEELIGDTEGTLRTLLAFLVEPWDDALLQHDKKPHDVASRYSDFTKHRRASTKDSGAIYRSRVGAGKKEIDPFLKLLFWAQNAKTMRELGYR